MRTENWSANSMEPGQNSPTFSENISDRIIFVIDKNKRWPPFQLKSISLFGPVLAANNFFLKCGPISISPLIGNATASLCLAVNKLQD